jgi:Protein of unknown function (DUF3106)
MSRQSSSALTLIMYTRPLVALMFFSLTYGAAQAQSSAPAPAPIKAASGSATNPLQAVKPLTQKKWSELPAAEQSVLAPLKSDWTSIDPVRQAKWLEIARNYPKLTPTQQQTLQTRMKEWASMSPTERNKARLNYAEAQKSTQTLTPEEKRAKWEAYQALSAEEKQKLAKTIQPLPNSASLATKPTQQKKLTAVPSPPANAASSPKTTSTPRRIDVEPSRVNRQTLLPQLASPSTPASR